MGINFNNKMFIELHVIDFEVVERFYAALGFSTIWRREPVGANGYLVMDLEGNLICFWCGNEKVFEHEYFGGFDRNTRRGYGVEIAVSVSDPDKVHEAARQEGCVVEPLTTRPWGVRDFRIADPNGYYLRITEPFDMRDKRLAE